MGLMVVVLLLTLWASILLPSALRGRRASPLDTVSDFERSMTSLSLRSGEHLPGRTVLVLQHPASVTGGSARARVLARRRATLKTLVIAFALGAVVTPFTDTIGLALMGVAACATAGYVAILRAAAVRAEEARAKTHRLVPRSRPATPIWRASTPRPQQLRRTGT